MKLVVPSSGSMIDRQGRVAERSAAAAARRRRGGSRLHLAERHRRGRRRLAAQLAEPEPVDPSDRAGCPDRHGRWRPAHHRVRGGVGLALERVAGLADLALGLGSGRAALLHGVGDLVGQEV